MARSGLRPYKVCDKKWTDDESLTLGEPGLDVGLEDVEGDGAGLEDGVVEFADVEGGSLFFLGLGAEFADFELAQFVGEGLAGPDDVAIDFDRNVLIGFAGVVFKKLNRLF